VYICSLVDGDVFECLSEVFNVIVVTLRVLCSFGEVVGRFGPNV